jgi:hypothetical protein
LAGADAVDRGGRKRTMKDPAKIRVPTMTVKCIGAVDVAINGWQINQSNEKNF